MLRGGSKDIENTEKDRLRPFPKQAAVGTYALAPMAIASAAFH
jgi:hypothetical protein